MAKGVPYDTAFAMTQTMALSHQIAFGMNDGGTFDWHSRSFVVPRS